MTTDTSKSRYPHVPERDRRICARYDEGRASGLTLTDLGKEFRVSRTIVSSVIHKRDSARKQTERLAPLRDAFAKGIGRPVSDRR
jgi:hypothetical protein